MLNRLFCLTIGAALLAGLSYAQAPQPKARADAPPIFFIEGSVVDAGRVAIAGVVVSCGPGHRVITGSDGRYRLTQLDRSKPSYEVVVDKAQYSFRPDRRTVATPRLGNVSNIGFVGTPPAPAKRK
jgi:hypothetical protein